MEAEQGIMGDVVEHDQLPRSTSAQEDFLLRWERTNQKKKNLWNEKDEE